MQSKPVTPKVYPMVDAMNYTNTPQNSNTLSPQEQEFLIEYINLAIYLISENVSINEIDIVFGLGQYTWPKNGNAPTSVTFKKLKIPELHIGFNKENHSGLWSKAYVIGGNGSMPKANFNENVFSKLLKLEFSSVTPNSDGAAEEQDSYRYIYRAIEKKDIEVIFYAESSDFVQDTKTVKNFTLIRIIKK